METLFQIMKLDNNFAPGKERFRFYLSQPDENPTG